MNRYFDGARILEDVRRALESALSKHGLTTHSLLGVTTALEAIATDLKLQCLQGIAGREMGRFGMEAYNRAVIARRVALLQSPQSSTVNPLMESIAMALEQHPGGIADSALELATLRVFLQKPRLSKDGVVKAHRENPSLSTAFISARAYLSVGEVISFTDNGWRLNS